MTTSANPPLRIVLPGGSGQIGTVLARHFHAQGHHVTVLSRSPRPEKWHTLAWDGLTLDPAWTHTLEAADVVIHLSGRSVNCRYTPENRRQIMDSRVLPTLTVGRAIEACAVPPRLWMNASTSTFYRDTRDLPQDEFTQELGGSDTKLPSSWEFSLEVAKNWEDAFYASYTPATRKIALRTSITMSPDSGGVFSIMYNLCRFGLGGTVGSGTQFVSWMHDQDYIRATEFLIDHPEISGPVNFTSPNPIPNRDFMRAFRRAVGNPIGLPAPTPILEIGTFIMRTESELVLKSRRAIPTVLLQHGFTFEFPSWPEAVRDLVTRFRSRTHKNQGPHFN